MCIRQREPLHEPLHEMFCKGSKIGRGWSVFGLLAKISSEPMKWKLIVSSADHSLIEGSGLCVKGKIVSSFTWVAVKTVFAVFLKGITFSILVS